MSCAGVLPQAEPPHLYSSLHLRPCALRASGCRWALGAVCSDRCLMELEPESDASCLSMRRSAPPSWSPRTLLHLSDNCASRGRGR